MNRKTQGIRLNSWIVGIVLVSAAAGQGLAQDVRSECERAYRGWVNANERKDFRSWKRNVAEHRFALTHNMVKSRKDEWPKVLFEIPFRAPDIATLRHMSTFQEGPTAHLIYYGKVDFGILDPGQEAPENILMLRFIKEDSGWKFDNTRFFNLSGDPAAQEMAKKGDLTILTDDRFQPTGVKPETPRLIESPDYVGEMWIASIGYETKITIADLHTSVVGNNVVTDLVIGGLSRNGQQIQVEVSEIEIPEDVERRFEIEIYALRPGKKAHRVWQWKPKPEEVLKGHESKVWANAVTIPGG